VRFKLDEEPRCNAAADVRDRVSRVQRVACPMPCRRTGHRQGRSRRHAHHLAGVLVSETMSPLELTDLSSTGWSSRGCRPMPGVADITDRWRPPRIAMRVVARPRALAAHRLTVQDVEDAHAPAEPGSACRPHRKPAARVQRDFARTDLNTVAQFADVAALKQRLHRAPARRGRVQETAANERSRVRLNGVPSVSTGVIRNATANPLDVAAGVRAVMPQIQRDLPASVTVVQANDNSVFIDRSIKSVYTTVAEAMVLVALVVFVFLRTLRASIIPLVTIPVSLIGSFALIALAGFTINTLTLLALVLAIGLVVDDAIVVLENIFRHIEEGLTPFQAAIKGIREISFAVVAMTLTLAAVFAPLAFTPGRTGRLFGEFALTWPAR
jgi:multidrug efflux pump